MYFKRLWNKIGDFLPLVFIVLVLGVLLGPFVVEAYNTIRFRQEMKQMCRPEHYAGFYRAASGLYRVSCMDNTGQVRDIYIERDGVLMP
jgi:hypothetical protein